MMSTERLTACAQYVLTLTTLVAFVGLIFALLFKPVAPQVSAHHDLIIGLTNILGTILVLMANFWFARHRPDGSDNPPAQPPVPPTQPAPPAKVP
ncbi:MAG TPA: hypothetical protein VMU47_06785 [Caldimonas sp.]|nr:hypothetical protein [Caldimonas sp.]